jgi:hypothetical protein
VCEADCAAAEAVQVDGAFGKDGHSIDGAPLNFKLYLPSRSAGATGHFRFFQNALFQGALPSMHGAYTLGTREEA